METEIREWLESKGVSLWADWLITSEDGMDSAVAWFANEVRSFATYRANKASKALVPEFDVV